jgi:hypothetical protein
MRRLALAQGNDHDIGQMAALFGVDVRTIQRWVAEGRLPPGERPFARSQKPVWRIDTVIWVVRENCRHRLGLSKSEPTWQLPEMSLDFAKRLYRLCERLESHSAHDRQSGVIAKASSDPLAIYLWQQRVARRKASRVRQARRDCKA